MFCVHSIENWSSENLHIRWISCPEEKSSQKSSRKKSWVENNSSKYLSKNVTNVTIVSYYFVVNCEIYEYSVENFNFLCLENSYYIFVHFEKPKLLTTG